MAGGRYLIVNADDFGRSPCINRGLIRAHEQGIVTSASLMVRWPAAAEAAAYGRAHPELSLGLHVDLGEWTLSGTDWRPVYEVVDTDDAAAIAGEVGRQLDTFRSLVGRDPTHLDSHQHVHRTEPVRSIMSEAARPLGIPVRHVTPAVQHCGAFYGQTAAGEHLPEGISRDGLLRLLAELPPGVTELGCHPGEGDDLDSAYRDERAREVAVLCDPAVRAALLVLGIELTSFHFVYGGGRISERALISRRMRDNFEYLWQTGDAWDLESSEFEQTRYDRLLALLADRRYGNVLEVGCGSGELTRRLAGIADRVVATDIAAAAVERARQRTHDVPAGVVTFHVDDVMNMDLGAAGPWDLVVLSETTYCLGWLYPLFDIAWLAVRIFEATRPGGRLLLANAYGRPGADWLLMPCLIDTYRDLVGNVGFHLESEEVYRGIKYGMELSTLISLFTKEPVT
jgi:predicted glycoside hydrolase/deacetylase ChbG (UPF0249 family)/SAM-dependent methyltransferase